jgi:hypothetical protein
MQETDRIWEKYKLPPVYKIVALRSLTIGQTRDHFDQWEAEDTSLDEDEQLVKYLNKVRTMLERKVRWQRFSHGGRGC